MSDEKLVLYGSDSVKKQFELAAVMKHTRDHISKLWGVTPSDLPKKLSPIERMKRRFKRE